MLLAAMPMMFPLTMATPSTMLGQTPAKQWAMPGRGSWQQTIELQLPFSAAKIRVRSKFETKGYILKHFIPIGKREEACLMLWEQGESRIIVMLWKIDTDRTRFSQGEFKDAK